MERNVKEQRKKMSGRTLTDRFQHLLLRLKRSNMHKLPEVCQWGSTGHTASGYGTNIMKQNPKKERAKNTDRLKILIIVALVVLQ